MKIIVVMMLITLAFNVGLLVGVSIATKNNRVQIEQQDQIEFGSISYNLFED